MIADVTQADYTRPVGGTARRRSIASRALRAIEDEIAERLTELAVLERVRDTLERFEADPDQRCDAHNDEPCDGQIHARFCRDCELVVRRCETHGGIRGAHAAYAKHREQHDAGDRAAAEPKRVPRQATITRLPVPVDRVPVSPAPRGRVATPTPAAPPAKAYNAPAQQPRAAASGGSSGPLVFRRRANRPRVDR